MKDGPPCRRQATWVVSQHYLGYPSGEVAAGRPVYYCNQHILTPVAGFLSDEGKKALGITVMRVNAEDKVVLRHEVRTIEP